MRRQVVSAAAAFLVMEPATYAAHRWVMHGIGWVLHRSHHAGRVTDLRARAAALEANDAFPCVFASCTILAMALGGRRPPPSAVIGVSAGVTAYGLAYGLVHDVYIHARLGRPPGIAVLDRLADAHRLHHRFGGEPYGMLLPIVPRAVRALSADDVPRSYGA